ncbi:hypothetical protein D9M71_639030 [compost metagenome]
MSVFFDECFPAQLSAGAIFGVVGQHVADGADGVQEIVQLCFVEYAGADRRAQQGDGDEGAARKMGERQGAVFAAVVEQRPGFLQSWH